MQKSALVIDDSRVARMTLVKHLKSHGFAITQLGSGEEALDWLSADDHHPDIIFMDVMMEGMDGLTATRRIKANPKTESIPVVICSGNDAQEEIEAAISTGAVAVLAKPPQQEQVDHILDEVEATQDVIAPTQNVQPTSQPQPQPQPIQIDEVALIQKLISAFEAQHLPAIKDNIRTTVEDITNQVAAEVTENVTQTKLNEIQNSLQSFITSTTEQSISALSTELEASSLKTVSNQARGVIEQKVGELNITEMIAPFIETQTEHLSMALEERLAEQLQEKVDKTLQSSADSFIKEDLPSHVESLMKPMLEATQAVMTEEETQQTEMDEKLTQQMQLIQSLQNQARFAMIFSLLSIATVAGVLAYTFLM